MRLNTSGLFDSTNVKILGTSGEQEAGMQQIEEVSSIGTTAFYLTAANAGKLHIVTSAIGSSVVISLPTTATVGISAGMYWDIFSNTTAAGVIDIALIGEDKGTIYTNHSSVAVATTVAVTHGTSGPFWVRVMCESTADEKVYVISNFMGTNGSSAQGAYYTFAEGSSALS
jgi:hypothetical protein